MKTQAKRKTPREQRHEINRQKILDTARKILVSEGLAGLSMRTLADQILYSPSAIYNYYENKEAILQAIRDEGWQLMSFAQSKVSETLPPPEKLLASGKAYLAFAENYPEHYLLMFNTPDVQDESVSEISVDPRFSGLTKIIQDGVESGHFKLNSGFTPVSLAFQMWITSHGIAMLRLTTMRNQREEFDALVDQIMSSYIASFTISSG